MTAPRIDVDTARSTGIVTGLLIALSSTADWNTLPREGVLRMLADLQAEIGKGHEGLVSRMMVSSTLLQAQEER